jgi:hypothetical protein
MLGSQYDFKRKPDAIVDPDGPDVTIIRQVKKRYISKKQEQLMQEKKIQDQKNFLEFEAKKKEMEYSSIEVHRKKKRAAEERKSRVQRVHWVELNDRPDNFSMPHLIGCTPIECRANIVRSDVRFSLQSVYIPFDTNEASTTFVSKVITILQLH